MDKDIHKLKIAHINLNHSHFANAQHSADFISKQIAVSSLNEPYFNIDNKITEFQTGIDIIAGDHRPRAAILINHKIVDFLPITIKRDLIISEIRIRDFNFYFVSIYVPPSAVIAPSLDELQMHLMQLPTLPIVINGDFNAKSYLWGPVEDDRGRELVEFVILMDMNIENDSNSPPTFDSITGRSWIDVTLTRGDVEVTDWQVSDEETMSDHRLLIMSIALEKTPSLALKHINYHDLDLFTFSSSFKRLVMETKDTLAQITTTSQLDDFLDDITQKITNICHSSKKKICKSHKHSPKW